MSIVLNQNLAAPLPAPPNLLLPRGLVSGLTITGLGDSITARSAYQPADISLTAIPAWAANTAYVVGQIVKNGGYPYRCVTAGTSAGSGGPSGTGSSIADNTAAWTYMPPTANRFIHNYLGWAERFSLGRLRLDLDHGYKGLLNGLVKIIVVSGGGNYASTDTVSFGNGSAATLQVDGNGRIIGATVTNPGQPATPLAYTITTATGSGAVLQGVAAPNGTFSIAGNTSAGMVAYLPDAAACPADIVAVHGGTNDLTTASYATITGNLRLCYETLAAAGKRVIIIPILPRTGLTSTQTALLRRVNHWIRSYARRETWANPNRIIVHLADPTALMCDAATNNLPIGGAGGVAAAVTSDGLHPNSRGAMYMGYTVWEAAKSFLGEAPAYAARGYDQYNGASPSYNPAGNYFEGVPWQASTNYALGDLVANDTSPVKIYRCVQAGASAGSSGPTGTGSNITDGGARWTYIRGAGMSIFNSGTGGTQTATAGITYPGVLATHFTLSRAAGSAAGTITGAIENPWSNGVAGVRQSLVFSLGSGTSSESWLLNCMNTAYGNAGLQAGDLGTAYMYGEVELELSNVANLNSIQLQAPLDFGVNNALASDGSQQTGVGWHMMASSGEPITYPNGGRMIFRTQPQLLPLNLGSMGLWLYFNFDASGAADSATATVKINTVALRKAYVA